MAAPTRAYRLTIPLPGSTFVAGQSGDPADTDFWVTSLRDPTKHNYLTRAPEIEGDQLDLTTGSMRDGVFRCFVSDIDQGGGTSGSTSTVSDSLTSTFANTWAAEGVPNAPQGTTFSIGPEGDAAVAIPVAIGVNVNPTPNSYGRYARTFSGFTPGTTYQVALVCRQLNRTGPQAGDMPPGGGIQCQLTATVTAGTQTALGVAYDAAGAFNSAPGAWETITVNVVAGADGTIRVTWGWASVTGYFIVTWAEYDSVTITEVSSPGLPAGRYVTLWLADADARMQLSGRPAYLDASADGGATWTPLTRGYVEGQALPLAQEWIISAGNGRRPERVAPLLHNFDAMQYPGSVFRPTPLLGGPVLGGFPPFLPDFGFPTAEVVLAVEAGSLASSYVALANWAGPLPPLFAGRPPGGYGKMGPGGTEADFKIDLDPSSAPYIALNAMAAPYYYPDSPIFANVNAPSGPVVFRGKFRGIHLYVLDPTDDSILYGPFTVQAIAQAQGAQQAFTSAEPLMLIHQNMFVRWPVSNIGDLATEAPVGTRYKIAIVPDHFSDLLPMQVLGHPADVIAEALEAIGLTVDVTSLAAVKVELGEDLLFVGELTDPGITTQQFVEQIGQAYGIATTVLADFSRGLVTTRTRPGPSDSPSTINDAVVVMPGGEQSFEISDESRKNIIRVRCRLLQAWLPNVGIRRYNDLLAFGVTIEEQYSTDGVTDDSVTYGERVLEFQIPGMTGMALRGVTPSTTSPVTVLPQDLTVQALAERLFDRHGRGMATYTLPIREGQVTDDIGDVVYLDVDHLPNAQPNRTPSAQRGGVRLARVAGRRGSGARESIVLADEGSGTPYAGAFGISSIAADNLDPTHYILVTLTGMATLVADEARVDIYAALTTSNVAPTDRGVHIFTLPCAGRSSTDTSFQIAMPVATTGQTWWIRAEAWVPGGRPGPSTYWYSLNGPDTTGNPSPDPNNPGTPGGPPTLPTPPAPAGGDISSLVNGTLATDSIEVTWDSNNAVDLLAVYIKLASETAYRLDATLAPGSTRHTFVGLVADTPYDIRVLLLDPATGGAYITLTTTQSTTAGDPATVLQTPTNPRVFAGYDPALGQANGFVGLMVSPVMNTTHAVEFEVTPETAVGSGIPSGWPSDASPDQGSVARSFQAVAGGTYFTIIAPNDGRYRWFRARAIKGGPYTPSAWTAALPVLPRFDGTILLPTGVAGGQVLQIPETAIAATSQRTGEVTIPNVLNFATLWYSRVSIGTWRFRVYRTAAARTADAARAIGTNYTAGNDLWAEAIFTPSALDFSWSPQPQFGPATSGEVELFYLIDNLEDYANDFLLFNSYTTS